MDGIDRLHRKVIHTRTLASSATDTIGYGYLLGFPKKLVPGNSWNYAKQCCLVVSTLLKNGLRQLGWWHSIPNMMGKSFLIPWFQSPPTSHVYPPKTMVLLNLAGAKLLKFKSDRFSSTLNSNVLLAKKPLPISISFSMVILGENMITYVEIIKKVARNLLADLKWWQMEVS